MFLTLSYFCGTMQTKMHPGMQFLRVCIKQSIIIEMMSSCIIIDEMFLSNGVKRSRRPFVSINRSNIFDSINNVTCNLLIC